MTTNTHDTQHRAADHDAISADVQAYLDQGKMIEILGPTPLRPLYTNHRHNQPEKNSGR
jgi:hypothetical protein